MTQNTDAGLSVTEKAKRDRSNKRIGLAVFIVLVLAYFFLPDQEDKSPAPQERATVVALPAYKVLHQEKLPGIKLSLDLELAAPVDEATLRALGEKVYKENKGAGFKNVFIMWYLAHYKRGAGAWGITNFTGPIPEVKVMALQG